MDLAEFERGKVLRGCGYTKTAPRKWTDSEIEYMKKLTPAYVGEWRGIARVWFTIEPYKVTEQWDKEV